MDQNMIKAVLFDFDGVLTTDATGSQSICEYISKNSPIDADLFKSAYYKYNRDLLYGKTNHETIWPLLCNSINCKIDMSVLYESFINTSIDYRMMEILINLKHKHYKIGMVTDNKVDRIDEIIKHHNWEPLFDTISISATIGSGKDERAIFERTLDQLCLKANQCVFIDNQEKNLIVPASMGINVIYFDHDKRDYQKLDEAFKKLSLML